LRMGWPFLCVGFRSFAKDALRQGFKKAVGEGAGVV